MRRVLFLLIVGLLVGDAAGVDAFVFAERCTSLTDEGPDNSCPALCVRCGCCAQPTVPAIAFPTAVILPDRLIAPVALGSVTQGAVPDVFHVPKYLR